MNKIFVHMFFFFYILYNFLKSPDLSGVWLQCNLNLNSPGKLFTPSCVPACRNIWGFQSICMNNNRWHSASSINHHWKSQKEKDIGSLKSSFSVSEMKIKGHRKKEKKKEGDGVKRRQKKRGSKRNCLQEGLKSHRPEGFRRLLCFLRRSASAPSPPMFLPLICAPCSYVWKNLSTANSSTVKKAVCTAIRSKPNRVISISSSA